MILLILTIALVLRFVVINQSLWLDEAINVNNAAILDFKSLILNYSLSDFHPPLYHLILRAWILFVGSSEVAVRIPSIIFGVATVYVTYLLGKKLFEEKTALIAATLLATSPLAIYYSQEARMYSLAALSASLSVYFFLSLTKKDTIPLWIGFIAATSVMLYCDYLPYLLIPMYGIFLLLSKKIIAKSTLKAFIPAFIIIFILLTPWLVILPKQAEVGLSAAAASPAWAQVVGSPNLKNLAITFVKFTIGRISHDNDLTYAAMFAPIAFFVSFLFIFSLARISRLRFFLWYWFFGIVLLGYVVSFLVPVFAYFRFIFVLPAFYLIIASAINTINWPPLVRVALGIFLAINLTALLIYFSNPKFHRENWREATAYVLQNSGPGTIVLFPSDYTTGPFDYYNQNRVAASGALNKNIESLTEGKNKVFLFQYLSQITDPQGAVFRQLSLLGFVNSSTKDFWGVGFVYEFTK